jgi:sulfur carrier protein ThiS
MLKTYIGDRPETAVEPGRTIRQTLTELGIPPELVALALVNEIQQDKSYVLADGDTLRIISVVGGG